MSSRVDLQAGYLQAAGSQGAINLTPRRTAAMNVGQQPLTWTSWPSRENLISWGTSPGSNQASALVPATVPKIKLSWNSVTPPKASPVTNPLHSNAAANDQDLEPPVDGWNDDMVVVQNVNISTDEMISIGEVSNENRMPSARGRQEEERFTWTREDRTPRTAKSPCNRNPTTAPPRLVWSSAPLADVLWPPNDVNTNIASNSMVARQHSCGTSASAPIDTCTNRYEFNGIAQRLDQQTSAHLSSTDEFMGMLQDCGSNENRRMTEDPYEDALGNMQRLLTGIQGRASINLDNPFNQGPGHGHSGSPLTQPLNCEFGRLLLDSVRLRCLAPTSQKQAGQENYDEETSRHEECSNAVQDLLAWGALADVQHRSFSDKAMCQTVIENLFFDSMPRQHVEILGVQSVGSPTTAQRFLKRIEDENSVVGVTFYGAQPEQVSNIVHDGILPQDWGAYVGAHAGVAHLHAVPNQKGQRFLCVLLTAFDQRAGEQRHPLFSNPQDQAEVNALDRIASQAHYGPVDEDLILVSHLITYDVQGGTQRVGGGFDDPFLRRLSSAVQRAGTAAPARLAGASAAASQPRRTQLLH